MCVTFPVLGQVQIFTKEKLSSTLNTSGSPPRPALLHIGSPHTKESDPAMQDAGPLVLDQPLEHAGPLVLDNTVRPLVLAR